MKQVIVLLFSGATIPLAFFPEGLRRVVDFLPFRAVYDSPLTILLGGTQITEDVMNTLLIQLIWVVILGIFSRGFWKISLRQITVNGG
jgi:ABC-2 type transport system permease protein